MIQRFALLLGFPTLSLSVSLFTLLITTAIGARYSAIVLRWPRTGLPAVVLLLAVIAIAYLYARRSADRSRAGLAAMGPDRARRGAAAADRPAARRVPADGHDGGRRARSGAGRRGTSRGVVLGRERLLLGARRDVDDRAVDGARVRPDDPRRPRALRRRRIRAAVARRSRPTSWPFTRRPPTTGPPSRSDRRRKAWSSCAESDSAPAAAAPGADDGRTPGLRRHSNVVEPADLGGRQRHAIAVDVVRLGRRIDDDLAVVTLRLALVDVADGDHRPGQCGTGGTADAPTVVDRCCGRGPAGWRRGRGRDRRRRTNQPTRQSRRGLSCWSADSGSVIPSRYDVRGAERDDGDDHPRGEAQGQRPPAEATQPCRTRRHSRGRTCPP